MNKDDKSFLAAFAGVGLFAILINLAFWGGLIWLALTLLQNFGVIGG